MIRWFILFVVWFCTAEAMAENVLLFTIDSCRADRFGCNGNSSENTPNIDQWAKSGTVFTQAYSTASWTAPGLASILTGLYPPAHGINNRDLMGSNKLVTLAGLFEAKGYVVPNLNFFTFAPYYRNLGFPPIEAGSLGPEEEDTLLGWLRKNQKAESQKPFFLWFHTTIVHQPYRPRPEDLPDKREVLEQSPGVKAVLNGAIVPYGSAEFTPEDKPIVRALYDAEIRRVDRFFGKVINALEEAGTLNETLVVLTADHGEELLDHGFVGHASTSLRARLYEEFVHIPLIVSWPGKVPSGEVTPVFASQVDVLPTIAKLCGLEVPKGVQGRDLFSLGAERALFFESVIGGNQTPKDREDEWVRGVRKGRHKYVSTGELYDLSVDPKEEKNLIEAQPELAASLSKELENWLAESKKVGKKLHPAQQEVYSNLPPASCPRIYTPQDKQPLNYEMYTGALLFDWTGDMGTTYMVEYDIGTGDHHVAGNYEADGNHQVLGPFPRDLWQDLKAWNPFRIRVSPKMEDPCWSDWVEFYF